MVTLALTVRSRSTHIPVKISLGESVSGSVDESIEVNVTHLEQSGSVNQFLLGRVVKTEMYSWSDSFKAQLPLSMLNEIVTLKH